ncbi:hypothetical protein H4217_000895 [Coemansia sp. RSA 1939]|nr:hypothetical protein H4217_000895 [Coemansia sp. RSA 1939]
MKFSAAALVALAISTAASAAPIARPDGVLGGVVDAVAPITAGLGTTLNNLLGFTKNPEFPSPTTVEK